MPSYLKLIGEADFANYDIITEKNQRTGESMFKIRGPYLMADRENGNGRIYPYKVLNPQVEKYVKERVETGGAMGELEHPDYTYVNLERACHKVTSLKEENKIWVGESVILSGTPTGDIVTALLKHEARLGMSSRGVGKLSEKEESDSGPSVVESYFMICIDTVADPSIGQYVDGILESKDFMVDRHGMIVEAKFDMLEKSLIKLPKSSSDSREFVNTAVKRFLKSL
jgi:hypothetical protein